MKGEWRDETTMERKMVDLTLGGILGYIGPILILIAWYIGRKELKQLEVEGKFKYVEKDPWWKKNYIFLVFFRRAFYRPLASSFPYVIFIFPTVFMVNFYFVGLLGTSINGKAKKLEEMERVTGVVTETHRGKGKGSYDYIRVKEKNGNEELYRLCCFYNDGEAKEFKEKIQNTQEEVSIWYQDRWFLESYKKLRELKVNNNFITLNNKIHFKYNYTLRVERDRNTVPNLLWWLKYSFFGWLWLWWLNRKELPIHRLNRIKHYKKNRLKDR